MRRSPMFPYLRIVQYDVMRNVFECIVFPLALSPSMLPSVNQVRVRGPMESRDREGVHRIGEIGQSSFESGMFRRN